MHHHRRNNTLKQALVIYGEELAAATVHEHLLVQRLEKVTFNAYLDVVGVGAMDVCALV